MERLENLVSKAEIAYKSGKIKQAVKFAQEAIWKCDTGPKKIALRIFIARCYSRQGKYEESNKIYRELLHEDVYITPVVIGLFYNNFCVSSSEKMNLNLGLVKSCLLLP